MSALPQIRGLLPAALWDQIELILPPPPEDVGRRTDDQAVLACLLFLLRWKVSWSALAGCNCGTAATIRRRLRTWQDGGYWEEMEQLIRTQHPDARHFNWDRLQGRASERN